MAEFIPGTVIPIPGSVSFAEAFEIAREAARERRLRRDALGPEGRAWEDYGRRWAQMVSGDRA